MKIVKLESENIKRIKAVEIQPDGSLIIIGGRNAQGKSSVLDSIEYALAGGSSIPTKPIRRGEKKARVVVDLGNIIVTRTFTEGGSKLVVSDKEGFTKSSPQALLDSLTGKLSFDPLEFSHMDSEKQLKTLRDLVGVDFSGLDKEKKEVYDKRTLINALIKTLKGQIEGYPKYEDIPEEEISSTNLLHEYERRVEVNLQNQRHRDAVKDLRDRVLESDKLLESLREEIKRLREKWDQTVKINENLKRLLEDKWAEVSLLNDEDVDNISTQISQAEEINTKVRSNSKRLELQFDLELRQQQTEKMTKRLEEIETEKSNLISSSKLPIPGLTFDENGISYNGLPFNQAGDAEKIRISVAMGFAMNPKLKILLIRDGSLLDEDNLKMVAEMAEEADGQLWLERVGEGKEISVVIEDGRIKE